MNLTESNYYSTAANQAYLSASFIKTVEECPARAIAEMNGTYERKSNSALSIGSYVDAHFEGTLDRFLAEHPEMFKRDGTLKADGVKAEALIARAEADPYFMSFMEGQKQVIMTGTIGDLPFKAKFDVYQPGKRIVDLKTVKDFEPVYKAGQGKLTFAEAWNWPLQLAIYQHIESQNSGTGELLPVFLACISKQDPPDIEIVQIPQHMLAAEMALLYEKLPYIEALRLGIIEPERCGKCEYCRATKRLGSVKSLDEYVDYE